MNSWFPHDSTAASDAKVLKLRARYGWEGYALYFVTLEWLYQCADAVAMREDMPSLCVLYGKDEEYTKVFIDFCIEIGLFECENDTIFSPRLKIEKGKEIEKSARARELAERRWGKKKRIAKAYAKAYAKAHAKAMPRQYPSVPISIPAKPDSPIQKHLIPLSIYAVYLGRSFDTKEQVSEFIRRYARVSKELSVYDIKTIAKACIMAEHQREASKSEYNITLETVQKNIDQVKANKLPEAKKKRANDLASFVEKNLNTILSPTLQ